MFSRKTDVLRDLEGRIGYRFKNRALLLAALTHPSFCQENIAGEQNNQRLEYLGDAVLGLLAAQHAFAQHTDADEGKLTLLRAQAASGKALAEVAKGIGLGAFLRMGRGEELTGGRERAGMLADAMEALFGAAWMDGGLRAANKMFVMLIAPRLDVATVAAWQANPKGALQEWTQKRFQTAPVYERLTAEGAAHAPLYRVRVKAGDKNATGEGTTWRAAETAAATQLLSGLEQGEEGVKAEGC